MSHFREGSLIRAEMVEVLRYMWDRGHANTTGVSISERSSDDRIVVDQVRHRFQGVSCYRVRPSGDRP